MLRTFGMSFVYLALFCLLVSILFLLKRWKTLPAFMHLLAYYLIWNFLIEIGAFVFIRLGMNNLPLLHLYTLGELLFWSIFYFEILEFFKNRKTLAYLSLLPFLALIILNSLFIQDIFSFNSYAKTLVNVIVLGFSSAFFFQSILVANNDDRNDPKRRLLEIINTAVLLYYSGSLFVFMFSNYYLSHGDGLPHGFWIFNVILNLIFQILILIAIWKASLQANYSSS